jgi:hypothetical protein
MRTVTFALLACLSASVCSAFAHNTTLPTRIVNVAGGDMRVWTEGLEQRQPPRSVCNSRASCFKSFNQVFVEVRSPPENVSVIR